MHVVERGIHCWAFCFPNEEHSRVTGDGYDGPTGLLEAIGLCYCYAT
jgi:hypothetical protein